MAGNKIQNFLLQLQVSVFHCDSAVTKVFSCKSQFMWLYMYLFKTKLYWNTFRSQNHSLRLRFTSGCFNQKGHSDSVCTWLYVSAQLRVLTTTLEKAAFCILEIPNYVKYIFHCFGAVDNYMGKTGLQGEIFFLFILKRFFILGKKKYTKMGFLQWFGGTLALK